MDDSFLAALDQVARSGRLACDAIAASVEAFETGRRARTEGLAMVEIVDRLTSRSGRSLRLASVEAFHDFERSIAAMRSEVIRALVEEDGLTLTQAAKRLGVSRQAGARLYRSAPGAAGRMGGTGGTGGACPAGAGGTGPAGPVPGGGTSARRRAGVTAYGEVSVAADSRAASTIVDLTGPGRSALLRSRSAADRCDG